MRRKSDLFPEITKLLCLSQLTYSKHKLILPAYPRHNQFLQLCPAKSVRHPKVREGKYGGKGDVGVLNSTQIPNKTAANPVTKTPSLACATLPTRVCTPAVSSRNSATLRESS